MYTMVYILRRVPACLIYTCNQTALLFINDKIFTGDLLFQGKSPEIHIEYQYFIVILK